MSVLSGLLQGVSEGIEKQRQEKKKQADTEAEAAKERGKELLKGLISGDIEQTEKPEEAMITEPGQVIKRGLFGKAETTPARMYKRRQSTLPEVKEGQMLETSYDELGRPKGYKITETPEKKLEREIQGKELKSMAEKLPNLERAETAVSELKKVFQKGWTPKSVGKGKILEGIKERGRGAASIPMQSWTQTNPDLRVYLEDRGAFASLISKGGFMEAGVLTNQDIKRVLDSLPQPGDSKEVVDTGWSIIENIMGSARRKYETKKKEYLGKPTFKTQPTENLEYQKYLQAIGQ